MALEAAEGARTQPHLCFSLPFALLASLQTCASSLETLATQWIDPRLERVHNEGKGGSNGEPRRTTFVAATVPR